MLFEQTSSQAELWCCYTQCSAVITRSIFTQKAQKNPHSSPVNVRYGVCFVESAYDWYSASVRFLQPFMQNRSILDRVMTAHDYIRPLAHCHLNILQSIAERNDALYVANVDFFATCIVSGSVDIGLSHVNFFCKMIKTRTAWATFVIRVQYAQVYKHFLKS